MTVKLKQYLKKQVFGKKSYCQSNLHILMHTYNISCHIETLLNLPMDLSSMCIVNLQEICESESLDERFFDCVLEMVNPNHLYLIFEAIGSPSPEYFVVENDTKEFDSKGCQWISCSSGSKKRSGCCCK
mmetsp:Transcript_13529/g.17816  ORF Transcript_13529/g.17816 Transcript_13529/m.17816 type:complete len:129 (-) Transcript_13529:68-454(-)